MSRDNLSQMRGINTLPVIRQKRHTYDKRQASENVSLSEHPVERNERLCQLDLSHCHVED